MRHVTVNPETVKETVEAVWSDEDHVLEISNPGTDNVLVTVEAVMSAEHARQCLAVLFGELARFVPLTVD